MRVTRPPVTASSIVRNTNTLLGNLEPALPSGHMRVIGRPKPALGPSPLAGASFLKSKGPTLLDKAMRGLVGEPAGLGDTPPPVPPRSGQRDRLVGAGSMALPSLQPGSARASLAPTARPKPRDPDSLADHAEDFLNVVADVGEGVGLTEAPKNLRRFLAQDEMREGDDIVPMPRDEALRFDTIREAVAVNEERVRRSFVDKGLVSGKYAKALSALMDGGTINLKDDTWDRDIGPWESILNALWDLGGFSGAGVDFLFAFGQVKLVTRQNFSAIRRGNTIIVKGTVIHLWREKYDFDEATDTPESGLLTGAAIVAEEGGRAQKFLIRSGWIQNVEGTVTIENGTLTNPQLRWSDSNAVVDWKSEDEKDGFIWPPP